MNPLVSFVIGHPQPCLNKHCGTCGGTTHFFSFLQKEFPDKTELIKNLKALTGKEAVSLTRQRASLFAIIINLSWCEQRDLLEYWVHNSVDDPDLAFEVLKWARFLIPVGLKEQFLINAETCFLKSRSARDELKRRIEDFSFSKEIKLPDCIVMAMQADEEDDREKDRLKELAYKKRAEDYDALLKKPFLQRLHLILSYEKLDRAVTRKRNPKDIKGNSEWIYWRSALGKCSASDFASLNIKEVQDLIDLCAKEFGFWCHKALNYLYDRRHCLRIEAMEQFRQDYGHLTPEEQLNILLSKSVCIEHFPIELTSAVTHEWLDSLSEFDKNLFLSMLKQTRLRKWGKVRDRL